MTLIVNAETHYIPTLAGLRMTNVRKQILTLTSSPLLPSGIMYFRPNCDRLRLSDRKSNHIDSCDQLRATTIAIALQRSRFNFDATLKQLVLLATEVARVRQAMQTTMEISE